MKLLDLFEKTLGDGTVSIMEVGSHPYEFVRDDMFRYSFNVDNGDCIKVVFSIMGTDLDRVHVEFSRQYANSMITTMAITHTGDAFRIFSTVVKIIHDFARDIQPKHIEFSATAHEASRVKVYDQLAKKLANEFGGNYSTATHEDQIIYTIDLVRQYLEEVFGNMLANSYPIAVNFETSEVTLYVFEAKATRYEVSVQKRHTHSLADYELEFRPLSGPGRFTPWELVPQPDALKIFNSVGNAVVDFVTRHDPNTMRFTAYQRQHSRVRLWTSVIKRMSKKLGMSYSITQYGDQVEFKLIRSRS